MDENCGICQSSLAKGKTKIVHNDEEKWEHKFHKACINKWILTCHNSGKTPNCPLCPDFEIPDNKIPAKLKVIKPVVEEPEVVLPDEYRSEIVARDRLEEMMNIRVNSGISPLCLGIIFYSRNKRVLYALNVQTGIDTNWTLRQIKEFIVNSNQQIYKSKGFYSIDNISHNLSITNWTQWKYPDLRVADIHYGIPSHAERLGKFDIDLDDDATVDHMYVEYQTLLRENIKRGNLSEEIKEKMSNVYYEQELWHYGTTGPDDPGHSEYGFHNPDNPIIPYNHRSAFHRMEKSTQYSMMWLIAHVDYV